MITRKKIVFIALLSVLLSSCKSERLKETGGPVKDGIAEKQSSNNQRETQTKQLIDDGFVFEVIDKDLPISYFKSQFELVEEQVLKNRHDTSVSDTVMIFSNGPDTANFYVSPSKAILQEVVVNSQQITLNDSIKVGAYDQVIKRKFNLEALPDSLIVKDFENSSHFLFTFQQGRIDRIVYKAKYLD